MSALKDIKYPYKNEGLEGYVTAVNILAVEFLVKEQNKKLYDKYGDVLDQLDVLDFEHIQFNLSFNKHTSSLGAMITQGDYDKQKEWLLWYLDERYERSRTSVLDENGKILKSKRGRKAKTTCVFEGYEKHVPIVKVDLLSSDNIELRDKFLGVGTEEYEKLNAAADELYRTGACSVETDEVKL